MKIFNYNQEVSFESEKDKNIITFEKLKLYLRLSRAIRKGNLSEVENIRRMLGLNNIKSGDFVSKKKKTVITFEELKLYLRLSRARRKGDLKEIENIKTKLNKLLDKGG